MARGAGWRGGHGEVQRNTGRGADALSGNKNRPWHKRHEINRLSAGYFSAKETMTMPLETKPFDEADYLTSPEKISGFLSEADATNDPAVIRHAIDVAARAIERYSQRKR
jgi:hypothetical protein